MRVVVPAPLEYVAVRAPVLQDSVRPPEPPAPMEVASDIVSAWPAAVAPATAELWARRCLAVESAAPI